MAENRKYPGFYLSNFQDDFVQKFLQPNSLPHHLLLAPVGSGKTVTSSVVVREMVSAGARRILVLAPVKVLVDQYRKVLEDHVKDITIVILDRKILREVEI